MSAASLPALSLAAVPGRRRRTLELAQEIERRGFAGIYCPSFGDGLGLCEALALTTERIRFGTGIANIYTRDPMTSNALRKTCGELAPGRFVLGLGPALDTWPNEGWPSISSSIHTQSISLLRSTPVSMPISSSMCMKSSVAIMPVALPVPQ